jgi:hypothetical protein
MSCTLPSSAEEAWRLFIADHAEPNVTALDALDGKQLATFNLAGPASLYVSSSRQGVYAVQGSGDQVSLIASGIKVDDHGDHGDLHIEDPALINAVVQGDRPVHFVEHDGKIALFFDDEGIARLLDEGAWLGGTSESTEVPTDAPHHGVAAPLGKFVLVSRPHPQDPSELPIGIDVVDAQGERVGDLRECPDLHGEASSGDTLAIACSTGLLLAKEGPKPDIAFLPYDAALPEGKVTTLLGGFGMQYWLGNYAADRVAIIDPAGEPAFRLVNLPSRRVHFAVDPQQVKFAYIFTEDGNLHRLNVLSGTIEKTLKVTEPYSMDGEWSLPRPRIAVAGNQIAVTDPLQSVVHMIDAHSFGLSDKLAVAGMPYNIVAVGGSGESH